MTDAYYVRLHRRYEAFERRLKVREKETMRHGRYKLKERLELIRLMDWRRSVSPPSCSRPRPLALPPRAPSLTICRARPCCPPPCSFANLVGTPAADADADTLSSTLPASSSSAHGSAAVDPERVRERMVDEAEELLRKYDLMLPSERACVPPLSSNCLSCCHTLG